MMTTLLGKSDAAKMSLFLSQRNPETVLIFLKYLLMHTSCTKKVISKNLPILLKYFFWCQGNTFTLPCQQSSLPGSLKSEKLLM